MVSSVGILFFNNHATFSIYLAEIPGKFTRILKSRREYVTTSFDMLCTVDEADVDVDWFYNDIEMGPNVPHFERLEIKTDERDRICRVTDCPMDFNNSKWKATSETDETECTLIVKPLPTISDNIKDVEVKVGQVATFECKIDDEDAPFEWFINGEKLTENDRFSFKKDNPMIYKLTINDAQMIDDGTVAIQFVGGAVSSTAKLTVIDGDDGKRGKGKPRILNKEDLNAGGIKKGKSFSWTAQILGKPVTTNHWFLYAKELSVVANRLEIVNEETQSTITISNAEREDTGPYKLVVKNEFGSDDHTMELVVLTPASKPLGPLECLDITAQSCTLAWKAPLDDGGVPIREYRVELLCPKTKAWKKIGMCKPEPPLRFPVTDLEENNEYKFRVFAINDEGESEPLESDKPMKAKNSFGPPGPPQKVELADWDIDHMDLTWQQPFNNNGAPITRYTIERRCETTGADWEEVGETDHKTLKLTDTKGLVYKHKYQYRVFAYNKGGKSSPGGPTPIVACRKRKCKYIE